jgi:hypothetical protein
VRSLPLAEFAAEAAVPAELVERLVAVGAIAALDDGRYDSRDEQVASTVRALIDAGISFDAFAWALTGGRFRLRALGEFFSEPVPLTDRTYAQLAASLGGGRAYRLRTDPARPVATRLPGSRAEPSARGTGGAAPAARSSGQPIAAMEAAVQLTIRTLCLLVAVILFVLAAVSIDVKGISLAWLGMAFFAGSFLVPDTALSRR